MSAEENLKNLLYSNRAFLHNCVMLHIEECKEAEWAEGERNATVLADQILQLIHKDDEEKLYYVNA